MSSEDVVRLLAASLNKYPATPGGLKNRSDAAGALSNLELWFSKCLSGSVKHPGKFKADFKLSTPGSKPGSGRFTVAQIGGAEALLTLAGFSHVPGSMMAGACFKSLAKSFDTQALEAAIAACKLVIDTKPSPPGPAPAATPNDLSALLEVPDGNGSDSGNGGNLQEQQQQQQNVAVDEEGESAEATDKVNTHLAVHSSPSSAAPPPRVSFMFDIKMDERVTLQAQAEQELRIHRLEEEENQRKIALEKAKHEERLRSKLADRKRKAAQDDLSKRQQQAAVTRDLDSTSREVAILEKLNAEKARVAELEAQLQAALKAARVGTGGPKLDTPGHSRSPSTTQAASAIQQSRQSDADSLEKRLEGDRARWVLEAQSVLNTRRAAELADAERRLAAAEKLEDPEKRERACEAGRERVKTIQSIFDASQSTLESTAAVTIDSHERHEQLKLDHELLASSKHSAADLQRRIASQTDGKEVKVLRAQLEAYEEDIKRLEGKIEAFKVDGDMPALQEDLSPLQLETNLNKARLLSWQAAFKRYDLDHSGTISVDELELAMCTAGQSMTRQELDSIMIELDADGSGEVDEAEYIQLMEHHQTAAWKIFSIGCINCGDLFTSPVELAVRLCAPCVSMVGAKTVECLECHAVFSSETGLDTRCAGCDAIQQCNSKKQVGKGMVSSHVSQEEAQANLRKAKLVTYRIAFESYDDDDSGAIQLDELQSVIEASGSKLTSEQTRNIFAFVDKDGDGTIDFDEFVSLMDRGDERMFAVFQIGCYNCRCLFTSPDGSQRACPQCVAKSGKKKVECSSCHVIYTSSSGLGKRCLLCRDASDKKEKDARPKPVKDKVSKSSGAKKAQMNLRKAKLASYKVAFDRYDTDRSGTISAIEVRDVCRAAGQDIGATELMEILMQSDTDGDGELSWDEFCSALDQRELGISTVFCVSCINCCRMFQSQDGSCRACPQCVVKTGAKKVECVVCFTIFNSVSGASKHCTDCRSGAGGSPKRGAGSNASRSVDKRAAMAAAATLGMSRRQHNLRQVQLTSYAAAFDVYDTDKSNTIEVQELQQVLLGLGKSANTDEVSSMMADVDVDGSGSVDFEEFTALMDKHMPDAAKRGSSVSVGCINCLQIFKTCDASLRTCGGCENKLGCKKVECVCCHALFTSASGTSKKCIECRKCNTVKLEERRKTNAAQSRRKMLQIAFDHYDSNGSGTVDKAEISNVLAGMGLQKTPEECRSWLVEVDKDGDGEMNFDEFEAMMTQHEHELNGLLHVGCVNCLTLFCVSEVKSKGKTGFQARTCGQCLALKGQGKKSICHSCSSVFFSINEQDHCADCDDFIGNNALQAEQEDAVQRLRLKACNNAFDLHADDSHKCLHTDDLMAALQTVCVGSDWQRSQGIVESMLEDGPARRIDRDEFCMIFQAVVRPGAVFKIVSAKE